MRNGISKKILFFAVLISVFFSGYFGVGTDRVYAQYLPGEVAPTVSAEDQALAKRLELELELENTFGWYGESKITPWAKGQPNTRSKPNPIEVTYGNKTISVWPTERRDESGKIIWKEVVPAGQEGRAVSLVLEPTSNSDVASAKVMQGALPTKYFKTVSGVNPQAESSYTRGEIDSSLLNTAREEDAENIASGTYTKNSNGQWVNSSEPDTIYTIDKMPDGTLRVVSKIGSDGKEKIKFIASETEEAAAEVSIYCTGYFNLSCWVANLSYHFIFTSSGKILTISGELFDFVVKHTVLNMTENMGLTGTGVNADNSTIYKVWRIFRDITNILFIFTLLYISIKTILQGTGETARQIGTVIIVAVTINFSLLVTKIIIDFSNIIALNIHTEIQDNAIESTTKNEEKTLARAFIAKTNVVTVAEEATREGANASTKKPVINYISITKQSLFGSALVLVVAFVLFVMSGMLLSRFVILMIIMITSSIAFGSYLIPKLRSMVADKWWDALFSQAFFAPVFFLFLLITLQVLSTLKFGTEPKGSFGGDLLNAQPAVFITFFMTIAMLVASLKIAKGIADKAGGMSGKFHGAVSGLALGTARFAAKTAGATVGRAATASTAWAGRNTLGALGNKLASVSGDGDGKLARLGRWTGSSMASRSYDVRNTKTGQAVAAKLGIKGGGLTGIGAGSGVGGVNKINKDASDDQKRRVAEMEATYKKKTQYTDAEQDNLNSANLYRRDAANADAVGKYDRAESIVNNSSTTLAAFDTNKAKYEAILSNSSSNKKQRQKAKDEIANILKAKQAHEAEIAAAKAHVDADSDYKKHRDAEKAAAAAKDQRGRDFMAANMSTDAGKAFNRQQLAKELKKKSQTDEMIEGLLGAAREMGGGAGGAAKT